MSCSECKYYLHWACFHLPPHLPSLPLLHNKADHDLDLQSCDILEPLDQYCQVCWYPTNGLFYACTKCNFIADIKCASVPDTIYHAAHPQHLLNLGNTHGYACDSCEFTVNVGSAVLPASVMSRRWDKQHMLALTYDANINHPGDFYCDECEQEMNPKMWMYHCRHCDLSFHPECFPTTSGWYRNIKLGQEYVNAAAHPHPLTYQLLTTKRRCDVCRFNEYNNRGFHCASCNFFICFFSCGKKMLKDGDIQAVD